MNDIEWYNQTIKESADKIRQELLGGRLYGFPIDLTNVDAVLVAAYWLALEKEYVGREHIEDPKFEM